MLSTHQGHLPKELALNGITDMESANRYLREVYLPAFNKEFSHPAQEKGTAFVPYTGIELKDVLCEQHSRVVAFFTARPESRIDLHGSTRIGI